MAHGSLILLSIAFGLWSCDPSSPNTPAGSGADERAPEFGTGNGPVTPGHSFVIRSDDGIFLTSVDEAQDLVVRHYHTEDADFCGGNTATPTAEAQLVLTPGAAIYTWQTGVLPVYVYRLSELPPQEVSEQFCQDLKDKWIYRGTHRLTNHDNNLFFEPGRTNAFGFNGEGTVFDRAGKKHSYRESALLALNPDPFIERHVHFMLSIR